jgi:hypothetical protein
MNYAKVGTLVGDEGASIEEMMKLARMERRGGRNKFKRNIK